MTRTSLAIALLLALLSSTVNAGDRQYDGHQYRNAFLAEHPHIDRDGNDRRYKRADSPNGHRDYVAEYADRSRRYNDDRPIISDGAAIAVGAGWAVSSVAGIGKAAVQGKTQGSIAKTEANAAIEIERIRANKEIELAKLQLELAKAEEKKAKQVARGKNPYHYRIVNNSPRTMEVTTSIPGEPDRVDIIAEGASIPLPELPEGVSIFDVEASGVGVNPVGLPGSGTGRFYRGRVQASGCAEGLCFTKLCLNQPPQQ